MLLGSRRTVPDDAHETIRRLGLRAKCSAVADFVACCMLTQSPIEELAEMLQRPWETDEDDKAAKAVAVLPPGRRVAAATLAIATTRDGLPN